MKYWPLGEIDNVARKRATKEREEKPQTQKKPAGPLPVSRWEFDKNPNDSIGKMHGVLTGGARITSCILISKC